MIAFAVTYRKGPKYDQDLWELIDAKNADSAVKKLKKKHITEDIAVVKTTIVGYY